MKFRIFSLLLLLCWIAVQASGQRHAERAIFNVTELSTTTLVSNHVTDTMSNGWLVACYESRPAVPIGSIGDTKNVQIFCRITDENDNTQVRAFQVSSAEGGFDPCVTVLNNNNFVVGFERMVSSGRIDVVARIFDSNGNSRGNLQVIEEGNSSFSPGNCDASRLNNSGFFMVWHSDRIGSAGAVIRGRSFNNNLNPQGDVMLLSPSTGINRLPSVDTLPAAGSHNQVVVVAWQAGTGSTASISARIVDPSNAQNNGGIFTASSHTGVFPVVRSLSPWQSGGSSNNNNNNANFYAIMYETPRSTDVGADVFVQLFSRTNTLFPPVGNNTIIPGGGGGGDVVPSGVDAILVNQFYPAVTPTEPTFLADMVGMGTSDITGVTVCWPTPHDTCTFNYARGTGIFCRFMDFSAPRGVSVGSGNTVALGNLFRPALTVSLAEGRPILSPVRNNNNGDDIGGFILSWELLELSLNGTFINTRPVIFRQPLDGNSTGNVTEPTPPGNVTEPTPPKPPGNVTEPTPPPPPLVSLNQMFNGSSLIVGRRFDAVQPGELQPQPDEPGNGGSNPASTLHPLAWLEDVVSMVCMTGWNCWQ